ncbi:MAG TPA: PhoU domain-containing protein [Tissierellales bacterium]|nr:PhoU domain-containing protein [Tissierellales bacterium]
MLDETMIALEDREKGSINKVVELENKVDELSEKFQKNHIKRLNSGICNIDAGVIYIDIISHLERIADHVYKISMFAKDELFGEKRM